MERMDLDIGSLFYILITVFAVIAGIAKKKKKPATGEPVGEEGSDSPKPGFFGKLEQQLESFVADAKGSLGGLTGQSPAKEPEYEEVDERDYFEKLNDDYEAHDKGDYRNKLSAYEGISSPDDNDTFELIDTDGIAAFDSMELVHLDMDAESSFEVVSELEDFDARTAIIYSSIINRIEI